MRRAFPAPCLLFWCALAAPVQAAPPASAPALTLPDSALYAYWVQSPTGTVTMMPVTVIGKKAIALPPRLPDGATVCVLDGHSGLIAARVLSPATRAIRLTVADFKAIAPSAAAPSTGIPVPVKAAPAGIPDPASGTSGLGRLLSFVAGLAIAAGVGWLLWRLVQGRGQPLVALARRVGVDVPDPVTGETGASAPMPTYQPPVKRAPEAVPDAATLVPPPHLHGGVPRLTGLEGLAAGSTFAVDDGSIVIGRDGESGIVLAENAVSRRHATLTRDVSGRVTLADLGSANGTFVNGQRVTEAILDNGDRVQIGGSVLVFEA